MIYALNVYDAISGKESVYTTYAEKAASTVEQLGLNVMTSGVLVIRKIAGQARNHSLVVQFPDLEAVEALM